MEHRSPRAESSGERSSPESRVVIAGNGTALRLSQSAYNLCKAVESGVGYEALAAALSRQGRTVTAAQVEQSYERLIRRLHRAAESPRPRLPPGFWLRWRLLPQPVVERLAARLSWLFASRVFPVLAPTVVLATVLMLLQSSSDPFRFEAFWPAYGLFVVSLLAHELGHSSACVRFGARPSDIGLALYLVYPAFYSDVTRSWELPRLRRVAVDLGGVYFQLVIGAFYAVALKATGWSAFETALWMILGSCLISMLPIFRFDGYWALADALDISRLDREPGRFLKALVGRLRGRGDVAWPWSRGVSCVIALYSVLALGAWGFLLWRLVPVLLHSAADYPEQALSVVRSLEGLSLPDIGALGSLTLSTLLLVASGRILLSTARSAGSAFKHGGGSGSEP